MTSHAVQAWSDWRSLRWGEGLSPAVLAEILDGGQAFRWRREAGCSWQGAWAANSVRLRFGPGGRLQWSAPGALARDVGRALETYFDAGRDISALTDVLPWRSDPHLLRCLTAFPGLRILRQPFGETLLCFMCSSAKQIVQIKQVVALLANRHGRELIPNSSPVTRHSPLLHSLPTWNALAGLPESALRACRLGFRARHIHQTAQFLSEHPGWMETTEALPYAEARARLCALPGVGEKIADCTLLFGAGRLEAFPVDVWIVRAMETRYGLQGWKPAQIAQFGRSHFGPHAGLAQQYLFAWERSVGKASAIKHAHLDRHPVLQ
jgi:N-glycosylase/DNA lyase